MWWGGVCLSACWDTPCLGRFPKAGTPPPSRYTPAGKPPGRYTPGQVHSPRGRYTAPGAGTQPPGRKGNVFTSMCQEFCPCGGGCLPQCMLGYTLPGQVPQCRYPTPSRYTPAGKPPGRYTTGQVHSPRGRYTPDKHTPLQPLQRTVRILLECILV